MAEQKQEERSIQIDVAALRLLVHASDCRGPIKYRGLARGAIGEYHRVIPVAEFAAQAHFITADYKQCGQVMVPYFGPTDKGALPTKYDPSGDCGGDFMSYKFQPNNNCYNYGVDIATNSFAQPGRAKGFLLHLPLTGQQVVEAAELDGLKDLGAEYPNDKQLYSKDGHCVALVIAQPYRRLFVGDYHWVRFDQENKCWSQKDGTDQVTNFDFAGNKIEDPRKANWTVNGGSFRVSSTEIIDIVWDYDFHSFMFVPKDTVNIF
mmetsp:Transcript_32050/g.51468  ORF Transcript_32050/g.51468 Transcript_32050/m.51468 type:complete len:263 (-) Transcript_32050:36-824(-)|eukprot:CAMPEP_0197054916 /NCGR_PEP_ID=MMETSP1384-20130603/53192_1 /TAXON_ID=29189 /ORGANISM="Ammonia sp." /LENGTH=262 /DNA_ID=CAMNT_0042488281 /DNA_START=55 /DNA_END=843 /DNA_ORIENTATION=+